MIPHLTLLIVLHRIWGAIGLILGLSTFILAAGAAAIGVTASDGQVAAAITAVAFALCAAMLVAAGGAHLWVGDAMRRHRPSGRMGALLLGLVNLFVLPFGTALAVYAYWVLLHDETRRAFENPESPVPGL